MSKGNLYVLARHY